MLRKNGWPAQTRKIAIPSTSDQSTQPAVFYRAQKAGKRPLLVGLHTWSSGYAQGGGEVVYARWCIEQQWHFVHPHFRGPNWTKSAMGSDLAVQDILDSVEYMKAHCDVDEDRIYLVGVSGGGYASLLMAGRAPQVWAGVSAWCSISDIEKWWRFHAFKDKKYQPGKYAQQIERALGGRPDVTRPLKDEAARRSPLMHLPGAEGVNLDINHGIQDGRRGSVPFTHSIEAFNRIAKPADRLTREQTQEYYSSLRLPEGLLTAGEDPLFKTKQPLFRRTSGNARLTLFDGGHEIIHRAALNWLALQKRGTPAKWKVEKEIPLESESGEGRANR